ncbi:aspartate ammonia-lyase [Nitratidesulfovibrio sp. HK-II]|uniref:aspartate ammonia-lyase n=1 Tax=Nitratidesulfovibrio sp. HK-II TaxID=2009266 RepID=UPI000EC5193A|nr:aspartate ammonia-lyase [Nitratidesulfovibrio sp. HK-II]GBO96240.1 aspartate ammonia-lyase [Nitratidesulfovibrio sp. HK-II]
MSSAEPVAHAGQDTVDVPSVTDAAAVLPSTVGTPGMGGRGGTGGTGGTHAMADLPSNTCGGCARAANAPVRAEHDLLGELPVPADAYHGIHTLRALDNFAVAGRRLHPGLVEALALVKKSCARANAELGYLDRRVADAVCAACDEMTHGDLGAHVLVDALQGGAGTSANMNVNEVLANRAEEFMGGVRGTYRLVRPLDHVNLHQSTNDVFPTALRVAAMRGLRELERSVAALQRAFQDRERDFSGVVKLGRTQLQDAVPMTLGAECSAWAEALSRDRWRIFKCEERLRVVNLGGTAVGTGVTAPRDYIFLVVERLREVAGLGLARAENLVDATQNADVFVEVSGILKAHAVNLLKISADLRLLASGPRGGLGELALPAVQAGSSLMPGKVNPVICEAVAQAAMRALGNDAALTMAAQAGQLELNAFLPLVADALLDTISILTRACVMFRTRCVEGMRADAAACARHVDDSWGTVTALVPVLGYEGATRLVGVMRERDCGLREAARYTGLLDEAALDALLSPEAMARLGRPRDPGEGRATPSGIPGNGRDKGRGRP